VIRAESWNEACRHADGSISSRPATTPQTVGNAASGRPNCRAVRYAAAPAAARRTGGLAPASKAKATTITTTSQRRQ
jgi:hypothetical protein